MKNYMKQKELYDPNEEQLQIHIYGVGSIGSHTAIALAKTGFDDITVYDYDIVEEDNLPAQFYALTDIQSKKTEALRKNIKTLTGTTIKIKEGKITKETNITCEAESIHIVCFDSIEARKMIYDKLKDKPIHYIDGRIGGFNYEKFYLKLPMDTYKKDYEQSLEGTFKELICGEKALWGVNSALASKITADAIKITQENNNITYNTKNNYLSDITIATKEVL